MTNHSPNWLGKPAAQMRAEQAAKRDAQPVTERCLFCDWTYTGTAGDGRVQALNHRAIHHPEAKGRKTYRKPRQFRVGEPVDDQLIEEQRRARAAREEAEVWAKVERSRLRREAA